ncbi:MAG: NAD kinase [Flavobacterium sp.]|nr:NAD kinase [Flavobacterium sp.]
MKVAIFGQYYQENSQRSIKEIFAFFKKRDVEVIVENIYYSVLREKNVLDQTHSTYTSPDDFDRETKLMISIGGDGTILRAATFVRDSGIPILGVNTGRLGFLAKVQQENIESYLQLILDGDYTLSARTVLSLHCSEEIPELQLNFALNEITVNRKDTTSMITIETFLDGEYLNSYWADGLIISTPTGSTGYSLSCGGPVLMPEVDSLVITPIAPHNLNARPLVIPDSTEIRLKVSGRESQYLVSLDSRRVAVANESILTITKTPYKIMMVELEGETFIKTLRNKLLWGQDKRN